MKEFEMLLEKFWIIKDRDPILYNVIKDAGPKYKSFVEDKLGYKLMMNAYVIKLEKLPGKAESWMGISNFDNTMEYAFLCIILMFLEDRGAGDQFVLSQVTEFIQGTYPGDENVDWTLYRHRKSLVKVLSFATEIGLIKVDDGDELRFSSFQETEVLYESTGLSRYFVRNFTGNVQNYTSYLDIENGEWLDVAKDRGIIRRHRVYRRLIMSPAVYSEGAEDADYAYIKNYKGLLQKDIEDMLDSSLHVHKNGAFLVLDPTKNFKDVFPDHKTISDITLQINGMIVEMVDRGEIEIEQNDILTVSRQWFIQLIERCRQLYMSGWSKEFREMSIDQLVKEVLSYMTGFGMVDENESIREIKILPLTGKIIGQYPSAFIQAV